MVHADYLFLLTDVDCLYSSNPRTNPDAEAIEVVSDISSLEADVSTAGSSLGTGGMGTKIVAAKLATSAGVTTIITRSSTPGNVNDIVKYLQATSSPSDTPQLHPVSSSDTSENGDASLPSSPPLHTRFLPAMNPIRSRSFWILYGLTPRGAVTIDEGAFLALQDKAGLLPAGVVSVEGNFSQQEAVRVLVVDRPTDTDLDGEIQLCAGEPREVGRILVNYSSNEINRIKGLRSSQIHNALGYADSEYVALRENISLFEDRPSRPVTPGPELWRTVSATSHRD